MAETLTVQDGVIARRQLLNAGLGPHDVARLVRARELASLHPGVYVSHTGSPTWRQRAWGAVQFAWPAALTHASALRAADDPGRREHDISVIEVAIAAHRRVVAPVGVRVNQGCRSRP